MRFRRRGRFHDLVERQLDLFAADEADLLARGGGGRSGVDAAPAEEAEEAYGDYQLVVDAIADRLLDIRESYARTLDEEAAEEYAAEFTREATKPLPPLRDAARGPRRRRPAKPSASSAGSSRRRGGFRNRASFRWFEASAGRALPHQRAAERVVRVVVHRESSSTLRNSRSAELQSVIRKYAIPSASRIEAFSGSSRRAFSSGTVACAGMPFAQTRPSQLVQVVGVAHRSYRAGPVNRRGASAPRGSPQRAVRRRAGAQQRRARGELEPRLGRGDGRAAGRPVTGPRERGREPVAADAEAAQLERELADRAPSRDELRALVADEVDEVGPRRRGATRGSSAARRRSPSALHAQRAASSAPRGPRPGRYGQHGTPRVGVPRAAAATGSGAPPGSSPRRGTAPCRARGSRRPSRRRSCSWR